MFTKSLYSQYRKKYIFVKNEEGKKNQQQVLSDLASTTKGVNYIAELCLSTHTTDSKLRVVYSKPLFCKITCKNHPPWSCIEQKFQSFKHCSVNIEHVCHLPDIGKQGLFMRLLWWHFINCHHCWDLGIRGTSPA